MSEPLPAPPTDGAGDAADEPLLALLRHLKASGYRFVTPTPATHARVIARPDRREARTPADMLGWSLPFRAGAIDPAIVQLLDSAGAVQWLDSAGAVRWLDSAGALAADGAWRRATVRVSTLHDQLFLHSAYPTDDPDAVFFGPDSYRFADLIRAQLAARPPAIGARVVDIGTGSGVGAIVAARACPRARVTMTDINPRALRLAALNARSAGVTAEAIRCSGLDGVDGEIDVAMANPPYIVDPASRAYRDGGDMHGGRLSLEMTRAALDRLAPGGRMILYTGSAIVAGHDALGTALAEDAAARGFAIAYRELDPDVFGEELDMAPYADVDRIALVAAIIDRPR